MSRAEIFNLTNFKEVPFDPAPHPADNKEKSGGGGPTMRNDYVTHEELDHAIEKIGSKIDLLESHIDTKFETLNTSSAERQGGINKQFETVKKDNATQKGEIDTHFERINTKLAQQETSFHKWILAVAGFAVAIIGLMIKFL